MDITFKRKKLEKIFNDMTLLQKAYGNRQARKILLRMAVLRAASSLADVPSVKPERCHPLKGERRGEFAVDLVQPYRLVFIPAPSEYGHQKGYEISLSQVTAIQILQVEDYH